MKDQKPLFKAPYDIKDVGALFTIVAFVLIIAAMLGNNPFSTTASSGTVTVTEINHGRSNGNTVRFRNVQGSPGGVPFSTYENSSGFGITVTTTDKYTFSLGTNASVKEEGGGPTVSAGPVTITP